MILIKLKQTFGPQLIITQEFMFYFEGLLLFLLQCLLCYMQVLPSEKVAIACRQYQLCIIIYDVSLKKCKVWVF